MYLGKKRRSQRASKILGVEKSSLYAHLGMGIVQIFGKMLPSFLGPINLLERRVVSVCHTDQSQDQSHCCMPTSDGSGMQDNIQHLPAALPWSLQAAQNLFLLWSLKIPTSGYYIHSTSQALRT